jgi:parallel beta-helix repeat protein
MKTLKTFGILLLLTVSLVLFSGNASASIITVCESGCDYTTINGAIDNASTCDLIQVYAKETPYTENIDFDGKAITVLAVNGPGSTTIDGDASGSVVTFDSGEGADSVLIGFTIQNGSGTSNNGGGIYIYRSSPTIVGCDITGNSVSGGGGGIWCSNTSSYNATITDCEITGNSAVSGSGIHGTYITISDCNIEDNDNTGYQGDGAGIYCGEATITNCTITGNDTSEATGSYGGGIYCGATTITDCTIYNNTAYHGGGGIYCYSVGTVTIDNCTITGNSAYSYGGGIFCDDGTTTITDSTISSNTSDSRGGGIYILSTSPTTITSSTITGNDSGSGGGIYSFYNSPDIKNCFITDNDAINGGGIFLLVSNPSIDSCTISDNDATGNGGGVFAMSNSDPTVVNSIFWGNTATTRGDEVDLYDATSSITITESDIDPSEIEGPGSSSLSDNINDNPDFDTDHPLGPYHLESFSPCIDEGATDLEEDFDGHSRPQGDYDDMGADEYVAL